MEQRFALFSNYLETAADSSACTRQVYLRDVGALDSFLRLGSDQEYGGVSLEQLEGYFSHLKDQGRSSATLARIRSSLSRYYAFLVARGIASENLPRRLKVEKGPRPQLQFLTLEQVRSLLAAPQGEGFSSRRDRAILHVFYATGLKSTQLAALNVDQVMLGQSLLRVPSRKDPFLPLYPQAVEALKRYLGPCRDGVRAEPEETALFLNGYGRRLTRQGIWKILGRRGKEAGIGQPVTPQLLRNSLAVHLAGQGATAADLQALLGLEDPYWANVYLRALEGENRERYRRLHPFSH